MPGLRYPERIRERAKSLWKEGLTLHAIAQKLNEEFNDFAPHYSTIWNWIQAWKDEGKVSEVAA